MKRNLLFLIAFFLALPAAAQKLDVGLQSSIVFQALNQSNDDGSLPDLGAGFQNAVGNLSFSAEIFEGGVVNTDVFISSKHHNETYGYQGFFSMSKLPEWMQLGTFGNVFDNHVAVRAGQMTLNYGDGALYRSVNGDVYNNELIGNPLGSPVATSLGMEATVRVGALNVMGGFSNGTSSGTIEQGKGTALHGKVWVTPFDERVRAGVSLYRVDHSANGTGYPGGGTKSYLYRLGDRAGSRYDVWNGADGGEIYFGNGQDETAVHLDARLDLKPLLIYGAAGFYRDADTNGTVGGEDNGNPEDQWRYYMATAKWNLTDWLYLAGRYSAAQAGKLASASADGFVQRIQIGGGFNLYKGILMKVEYVNQTTSGFVPGYTNNRMNLGLNPKFSGLSVETAVKL